MKQFMLLMKGDNSAEASPEEMQHRMAAYMTWMRRMTEEDRLQGGQPLEPTGALLENKTTVVTDGPFLEPKEIIGGYVILSATDLEEATGLARECPLLDHCTIIVRPVLDVPG